jgi:hypothetical protein
MSNLSLKSISIFLPFFIPPAFVLFTGEYIRTRIENFIHYQRLREIFYVLETAFIAFRGDWSKLSPPFSLREENIEAKNCKNFSCEHNQNRIQHEE